MYHDLKHSLTNTETLAQAGTDAVAYMREITSEEIADKFPEVSGFERGRTYWAMFAADGTPLMLADHRNDLTDTAYFNDLTALMPN